MTKHFHLSIYLLLLICYSCSSFQRNDALLSKVASGDVIEYSLSGKPNLRGVAVLNDSVVWVSGSKGTFARSIDGGKTWSSGKINNDTLLDFRDIQAFSYESAIAISAGSPARIYKTLDGGRTWSLKYENTDSLIFFNSIDFYNDDNGIACSDPIRGNFLLVKTNNGGERWDTISFNSLPKPLTLEAGFAASGTSVVYSSNGTILFGTGGDKARILRSDDFGKSWEAILTPIKAGDAAYGIYSIGRVDDKTYIIAGGCWKKPNEAVDNVAISTDSGKSWYLTNTFPSGFRSCIKYNAGSKSFIACGINGVDISKNMGKTWKKMPMQGYNALDISSNQNFIVFVGSNGRIVWISTRNSI